MKESAACSEPRGELGSAASSSVNGRAGENPARPDVTTNGRSVPCAFEPVPSDPLSPSPRRSLSRETSPARLPPRASAAVEGEAKPLALAELELIHRGKTGALVSVAALLGGVAAGASEAAIGALAKYGADLGLAFQIADDVLDVTGTSEALGKTAGRDAALRKSTYPSLLGLEAAQRRAEALVADGCAALDRVGLLTPVLESIAHFVVRRSS